METGSGSLLEHLQRRVAAFDAERADLLARLEACAGPGPAEVYALQAENRKRAEEVRELQKALSDAHTFLFEERERLLAVTADNDKLRLQECEDRARIKQLLSLTRPVEQRVVYARGGGSGGAENGPKTTTVLPRSGTTTTCSSGSKSPRRAGSSSRSQQSGAAAPGGPPPPPPPPERVLRTVYLPTAQAEAAALKCEALEAQLAEQKRFAAERIAALQEDRAIRERDAAAHAAALSATADALAEKLRAAEEALRVTTKDYILAKQQRDAAAAAAAVARGEAAEAERAGREAVAAAEQRAGAQLAVQRAEMEADARAATQALASQLAQREEELLKFETLHKLIRGQLEARAVEAERRAARLTAHNKQLQLRRAQEMEGWAADVTQLRKRIAAVDRQLRQQALLQRLPDGDVRDAALARHARLATLSSQDAEYECGVDELIEELLSVKGALLGMGERVARQVAAHEPSQLGGGGIAVAALGGYSGYSGSEGSEVA